MPSYDDDLPTQQEELLLKQLLDNVDEQERLRTITKVRTFVPGRSADESRVDSRSRIW